MILISGTVVTVPWLTVRVKEVLVTLSMPSEFGSRVRSAAVCQGSRSGGSADPGEEAAGEPSGGSLPVLDLEMRE